MDKKREILLNFDKDKLVDLLLDLLDRLKEEEKIQFISKNINSKLALENIKNSDDVVSFLNKVEKFCKNCIDGDYYVESYDWYNECDDEVFEDNDWANGFTEYLNTALIYSRNKDYDIAFRVFEVILNCIHAASFDFEILGTEDPEYYIDVDWDDVFDEYYTCIANCITDDEKMIARAFQEWLNFGKRCTKAIVSHVDNLAIIEKLIREKIAEEDDWTEEHITFELLEGFYDRYKKEYSKLELAKSFLQYNVNFYNDIAQTYFELKEWEECIKLIREALEKVNEKIIRCSLLNLLINCHENLKDLKEAFYAAKTLFYEDSTYENYKRTRYFAEKVDNSLENFIKEAEKQLSSQKHYGYGWTLIKVLSYEGEIDKLINLKKNSSEYRDYYYQKYICRSLLYHAFYGEGLNCENLNDFIINLGEDDKKGITDMLVLSENTDKKNFCIEEAVNILKNMVSFHIDAAKRSRYAKAAYYCSIIKEVFGLVGREREFYDYYSEIIKENNRRPALKDEMKNKIGRL